MKRVAIATCAHHPGFIANDDEPLIAALGGLEVEAVLARWDDARVEWGGFDAVVIRTTWDYQERLEAFLAWVERVEGETVLINPGEVVRRNVRKTYLRELEAEGIGIVPTRWFEAGGWGAADVEELAGWCDEVIVKPSIGAGASGLGRFASEDVDGIGAHIRSIEGGGPVLVQRYLPSIIEAGEVSIVVIEGEVSHAVRKVPARGDFRVQIEFGGVYTLIEPSEREVEVALRAVEIASGGRVVQARADLVEGLVGEIELIEPELFLQMDGAGRLARAIVGQV